MSRGARPLAPPVATSLLLLLLHAVPAAAVPEMVRRTITPLGLSDRAQLEGQRALVNEQALRHEGAPIGGDAERDLRILQRLVDERVFQPDQTHELQALGVVLGDVMARELRLDWVVVEDDLGRSRALRYRETEHLVFPVTMISKRYERGVPVDVLDLFERIRGDVADWSADDQIEYRKRFLKPRRPRARTQ